MRKALTMAALVLAIAAGTADAALQTRTMDAVQAEVVAREAALDGDLTKQEKKLDRLYRKAVKLFDKESTSRKKDTKTIKKLVKLLTGKLVRDDADLQALLGEGVDAFLAETDGALVHMRRANEIVDDSNKFDKKAEKFYGKADGSMVTAREQTDLRKRFKFCVKAEKFSVKARKFIDKALPLVTGLGPHEDKFIRQNQNGYTGQDDCLQCHSSDADDVLASAHFQWEGTSTGIEGHETHEHGKVDLLNNFCIAIPSNEPRCTQCHTGYDWKSKTYDRTDTSKVDCFVCHDTTGTYKKDLKTAGQPVPGIDLTEVALNLGTPSRDNCLACHAFAGGGDNVKHGDLASTIGNTTREFDVHMGTDGGDFNCQKCHVSEDHGIAGMPIHSQNEGRVDCANSTCHTGTIHSSATITSHLDRIACQTCHIPTFSRSMPTKAEWYWEDAGQNISPIPTDQYGKPLYDKKKGTFVWAKDVTPELRWFNGKWNRMIIGDADTYTTEPVTMAGPVGSKDDPNSKLYPFKKMIGNQPADTANKRIIVPHLFGMGAGPNPFWGKFDWGLAIAEGAAYAGQPYSGTWGFVETEMFLTINHEIAPKEDARGCSDCHNGGIDFTQLGYTGDPISGGK